MNEVQVAIAWTRPKLSGSVEGCSTDLTTTTPNPPSCEFHPSWTHAFQLHGRLPRVSQETFSGMQGHHPENSSLQDMPALCLQCLLVDQTPLPPSLLPSLSVFQPGTVPSSKFSVPEEMKYSRKYPRTRVLVLHL